MLDFLVKYPRLARLFDLLLPLLATLAALGVGAVMLQLLGANPFTAYSALLNGAFGSQNALADTIDYTGFVAGIEREEYTIGVQGCGQRRTYVVICPQGGDNCFAADSGGVVQDLQQR